VEKVKTMIMKGKPKKAKTFIMHQTDWKKAIVTLKEGSRIDII
jgi:ribosomal protein L23